MRVLRGGTDVDADGGREADVGIESGEIVAVEPPGRSPTPTNNSSSMGIWPPG